MLIRLYFKMQELRFLHMRSDGMRGEKQNG